MPTQRYIVIHHSATPDGRVNDWQSIRRYHMSWRRTDRGETVRPEDVAALRRAGVPVIAPWLDIGYHRGIEKIADRIIVQRGRKLRDVGAHCEGFNHRSVGLCIVGCFDGAAPAPDIWAAALDQVREIAREIRQDLQEMLSGRLIIGHRESYQILHQLQVKTCPGRLFDMDKFRNDLTAE